MTELNVKKSHDPKFQVDKIDKFRASMPNEVIYLITPSKKNVMEIVKDFKHENRPKYTSARICFTETCKDDVFELLKNKVSKHFIKVKEL